VDLRSEQALILDRIQPSVTPRVTTKHPPAGEDKPAQYAESLHRLRRVLRAGRVVLAARPEHGREQALIRPQRNQDRNAHRSHCRAPSQRCSPRRSAAL
jgi:hypothetical protein